ncbi:MAG: TM2 domain-containing protein [Leptolyngbyaceae cyanobacterium]
MTAFLAFLGAIQPTPIPLAGLHKFYLGQPGWGIVYLLLGSTPVPRVASAIEGVWCLVGPQLQTRLAGWRLKPADATKSTSITVDEAVEAVANSLREIEQLRQEGLLSEHEFEQKRRSLLEQIP